MTFAWEEDATSFDQAFYDETMTDGRYKKSEVSNFLKDLTKVY